MDRPSAWVRTQGRMAAQRRYTGGIALIALAGMLLLSACGVPTTATNQEPAALGRDTGTQDSTQGAASIELPHIHGIGYSADGRQLVVPAHDGFRVFVDGGWQIPELPVNDYMGYAATDDGFYSSGHPGPSGELVNPLGLVKSSDGGKSMAMLGFQGETDFHLMGVGYRNHAIYVLNPAPNSTLSAGLHRSLDDGKTWQQSAAQGLTSEPIQVAVHPQDANIVALATEGGLWLSSDYGGSFKRIGAAETVTAASFSPDGQKLFFGSATLSRYDMTSKQVSPMAAPALPQQDAIAYVAGNPAQPEEIAIATFGRNIFRSPDSGQSWQQIAESGKGQ